MDQASIQPEYNCLLEAESRDIFIRELKHECARIMEYELSRNPHCIGIRPTDAIQSFFEDKREELELELKGEAIRSIDMAEIETLQKILKDL